MKIFTIFVSLVAAFSLLLNFKLLTDRSTPKSAQFSVSEVIDGDTFTIENEGETRRVKLIGVNTPETEKCLSNEAKDKLSDLIADKEVVLEDQFSDPYGRIMANVFVDGTYVNKEMLHLGLGRMDYYENPHREELKVAYGEARSNKLGIYSSTCLSLTPPDNPKTGQLCTVKGNVDDNTAKKIYFLLDCNNYSQVTIDLSTDDQWFCTEEEAVEAGFSRSKTCTN